MLKKMKVLSFIAIILAIYSCDLSKEESNKDAELITEAQSSLNYSDFIFATGDGYNNVKQNFIVPLYGLNSTTISWASNNLSVIAINNGDAAVTRPTFGSNDVSVTLIATLKLNSEVLTKSFNIKVLASTVDQDLLDVNFDKDNLQISLTGADTLTEVTNTFNLIETGIKGSSISWSSNNPAIRVLNGVATVARPSIADGDATVILTATISKNSKTVNKEFTLIVKAVNQDAINVTTDINNLTESDISFSSSDSALSVSSNFTLPVAGASGTTISWVSNNPAVNISGSSALVSQPSYTEGDVTVVLTATVSSNGEFSEKEFSITVSALPATDQESVDADRAELLANGLALNAPDTTSDVTSDFTVSILGSLGSSITWSSNNPVLAVSGGYIVITRPTYTEGSKSVILTASIVKGSANITVTFNLTVTALPLTDQESVNIAKSNLGFADVGFSGADINTSVTSHFTLPTTGSLGTSISWDSNDITTISYSNGKALVVRPAFNSGDKSVTLSATITKNTASTTKEFIFTVKELTTLADWTIMVYLDADNDLERFGLDDFNEMEKGLKDSITAGNSDINNINVIVLLDRTTGYDGNATEANGSNWTDTRLYRVKPDTNINLFNSERLDDGDLTKPGHIANLGEKNMADPATLSWFTNYSKTNFPASNYSLILWNHGGGARSAKAVTADKEIEKAICWDADNGNDALYLDEVQQGVSASFNSADKLSLLGFDACLMATVEVAYEFRNLADYMVGSMNTEQGDGWWYDDIFGKFTATSPTPVEFATNLVISYRDFIEANLNHSGETLSAVDLSQMVNLKNAIDNFAVALHSENKIVDILNTRANAIGYFDDMNGVIGNPYFDLYDVCTKINANSVFSANLKNSANSVITALSNAIVYAYGDSGTIGALGRSQPYYLGPGNIVERGLSIFFSLGEMEVTAGQGDYTYVYQWWYTDMDTQTWWQPGKLYGKIDFCNSNTNGVVETWRELMEAWFDNYTDSQGATVSPNTPGAW